MDGNFLTHCTLRSDIEAVSACTRHFFPRHTHDQFGIGVIERGAHRSLSGRGVVEAVAGQAITVNPGEVHDGHPIGGASRAWSMLYFSPELARELTVEIAEGNNRKYEFESPVIDDAEVARLFLMLFRSLTAPRKTLSEVLADQTLLLLFARIARPGEPIQERRAPVGVRIAQELIDDDPASPRSLDDLAAASGLSRFQVVRAFVRQTGLTPHAYIVQRRLQLARRLISSGLALADAAAACGFSDQSHMTRLFRRTFGISPGAYSRSTVQ